MPIGVGCTLTGIYAGNVRTIAPGTMEFTGKKTDVTTACIHAVIMWMEDPERRTLACKDSKGRKLTLTLTIEEEQ